MHGKQCLVAALAALALSMAATSTALAAEEPEPLWQRCAGGSGDLVCGIARGVGANPLDGHVYLADGSNTKNRIVEYDAWGEFVRTWGWGVLDGSEELQACTVVAECQAGSAGGRAGEMFSPQGVAVDSDGNVYVAEPFENRRVQKFDSEGNFLFMFGGKVNKTKVEEAKPATQQNLCPFEAGDVCQAGSQGTGPGEFGAQAVSSFIVAGRAPTNKVYVGDKGRIQVFDSEGHYLEDFPAAIGASEAVKALALVPGGGSDGLYVAINGQPNVTRYTAGGFAICSAAVGEPTALATAVDEEGKATGDLYVYDEESEQVRQFSPACAERPDSPLTIPGEIASSTGLGASVACLSEGTDLYPSDKSGNFLRAYGPAPDELGLCPKPPYPPEILAQYAVSVGTVEATLRTQVNPRFGDDTTIYVQYGTKACLEADNWNASCVQEQPAPPELLGAPAFDFPFTSANVFLSDLAPATTYRYRFAAESSGGGPVFGVGGSEAADGSAAAFTTPPAPSEPPGGCSNAELRTGASAALPDCRAYEMVTPVDKDGGDVLGLPDNFGRPGELMQSASEGEKLTYSTFRSFGDAESAPPFGAQYIADRNPGSGWASENISPPQGVEFGPAGEEIVNVRRSFQAFSAGLCNGWLIQNATTGGPLASGAEPSKQYIYRRSNCSGDAGQYSAVGKSRPTLTVQGISADGEVTALQTESHLSADDAPTPLGGFANSLQCETSINPKFTESTSFQWLRNGLPIDGATGTQYTTSATSKTTPPSSEGDAGASIQCRVTVTTANSGATQVANPAWTIAPYPAVAPPVAPDRIATPSSGAPLAVGGPGGQALTCATGAWQGAASFSYQWYRDGAPLVGNGADSAEYTVQAADLAAPASFQCEVTGENSGGAVVKASANLLTSTEPDPRAPVVRPDTSHRNRVAYVGYGEGELRAACILPGGIASGACSAGTRGGSVKADGRSDTVATALTADGSRLIWTNSESAQGRIYARLNPTETQSALALGEATGTGKRTNGSSEVSEVKTTNGAFAVGQSVSGQGIAPGTTIEAIGAGTLTLSQAAIANASASTVLMASSECTEAGKACTVGVSEAVEESSSSLNRSHFWAASADGSQVLFTSDPDGTGPKLDDLYLIDVDTQTPTLIASEVFGVAGASEDLSRVYFASREALAGASPSTTPEGAELNPVEGEPNLYLYRAGGAGSFAFVAGLAGDDLSYGANIEKQSPLSPEPFNHGARATPDGQSLAFMATSSPTGYDNTDSESGLPAAEVFHYDAAGETLLCASCRPSGARPRGEAIDGGILGDFGIAAQLPHPQSQLHFSNVLSDNGARLFFESFDRLLLQDTNGAKDVYQWEAPGSGTCTASSPSFKAANGGCLFLISSGEAPTDSDLLDASADGRDVFIRTGASLVPQDPGSVDIYDARAGGGFPPPASPEPPCEGEACQSPPPPPGEITPSSSLFAGPGDISQGPDCGAAARQAKRLSNRAKRLNRAARRSSAAKRTRALRRGSRRSARKAKRLSRTAKRCRRARSNGRARR